MTLRLSPPLSSHATEIYLALSVTCRPLNCPRVPLRLNVLRYLSWTVLRLYLSAVLSGCRRRCARSSASLTLDAIALLRDSLRRLLWRPHSNICFFCALAICDQKLSVGICSSKL
jgi:hypothetical protein